MLQRCLQDGICTNEKIDDKHRLDLNLNYERFSSLILLETGGETGILWAILYDSLWEK